MFEALVFATERTAIEKAWGFDVFELFSPARLTGTERLRDERVYPTGPLQRKGFVMWARKDRLDMRHRYVTESIPYAFVPYSSAAAKVGVKVPITDSLIYIFSAINGEDYFGTGRSLDRLGLGSMNVEQIKSFLYEGYPQG